VCFDVEGWQQDITDGQCNPVDGLGQHLHRRGGSSSRDQWVCLDVEGRQQEVIDSQRDSIDGFSQHLKVEATAAAAKSISVCVP
jgi:hypothetical protein